MKYQVKFQDQDHNDAELKLVRVPSIGDLLKLPNSVDDELEYWKVVSVQEHYVSVVKC